MAQSYVGKRPISKGIGRVIRRFVIVAFALHASGRRHDATGGCGLARLRATGCGISSPLQLPGMRRRRGSNREQYRSD
jgi:hypothetical protein